MLQTKHSFMDLRVGKADVLYVFVNLYALAGMSAREVVDLVKLGRDLAEIADE